MPSSEPSSISLSEEFPREDASIFDGMQLERQDIDNVVNSVLSVHRRFNALNPDDAEGITQLFESSRYKDQPITRQQIEQLDRYVAELSTWTSPEKVHGVLAASLKEGLRVGMQRQERALALGATALG